MSNNPLASGLNCNLIRFLLIEQYIDSGEGEKIDLIYRKVDFRKIQEYVKGGDFHDQNIKSFRLERLTEYMASKGRKEDVFRIINTQVNRANRIKAYATAPLELMRNKERPTEDFFIYLDSSITEFGRVNDFFFVAEDPRISMILTLALQYVSKISIGQQSGATQALIIGTAYSGEYYEAYSSIPDIALVDRLFYFNIILTTEGLKKSNDKEWDTYFKAFRDYWIWESIQYEFEIL